MWYLASVHQHTRCLPTDLAKVSLSASGKNLEERNGRVQACVLRLSTLRVGLSGCDSLVKLGEVRGRTCSMYVKKKM